MSNIRTKLRLRDLHAGDQVIIKQAASTAARVCEQLMGDGFRFAIAQQSRRTCVVTCLQRGEASRIGVTAEPA